jgi:type I restriction enzyme S subunit
MNTPPIDIRPEHWRIINDILRDHLPHHAVWAIGSRARGRARACSDLDLVVVGERPLGIAAMAALAEAFSESDLPWKVDLIDWATTSGHFRQVIAREHRVLRQPEGEASAAD